ncbi:acyltransferase family protein [Sulfitobacter sp. SK011]|uniref:acyltransferase family protein n=1 Tax=Sulfitobacter sp. SK011 TaxID=1389004 RepID=UPI000E0B07CD|nr:acyltransferase family protein [Sulfitobacter sp. SK011]AXI40691.1 acyltransferase [Sulfitobacter sp. SK011]
MKYRPEIDGLRALAVLPVVLYHAGYEVFSGGFIGVDVFFVISGFLITTLIANDLDKSRFSIARFYERRARRILPALFLVMLVTIPFAWMWMMPNDLSEFLESLLATILFVSNFFFWDQTDYFDMAADLKPMLHTWSLAVEEQFYIIFPLVLISLWRFGRPMVLWTLVSLFLISFWLAQWGVRNDQPTAFFLLPARAWELIAGAFAGLYFRARPHFVMPRLGGFFAAIGLFLIILPVFTYDDQTPFPGASAVPPVLGSMLVIVFANDKSMIGKVLSMRLLVSVGLISYSLYLWHQPVFALVRHRFGNQSFDDHAVWLIFLSFGLAVASLWVFERPFRYWANLRQLYLSMGALVVFMVVAGLWIDAAIDRDLTKIPSYARALKFAPADVIAYSEGRDTHMPCSGNAQSFGFNYCDFGDVSAEKSLVVWGDSLSGALLYGINEVSKEHGLQGTLYTANGCPPIIGLKNTAVAQCSEKTHAEILNRILQLPNVRNVIIIGNFEGAVTAENVKVNGQPTSITAARQQIFRAVSEIHSTTAAMVYLVEQGLTFPEPVAINYIQNSNRDGFKPQETPRERHLAMVEKQKFLAEVTDGFLTTIDFFCNAKTCPSVDDDGKMVIYDRNHLTKAYSVQMARELLDQVNLKSSGRSRK